MIYTVTFNPSVDYMVSVKNFRPGIVNRTFSENLRLGGKGLNVSQMLKNLGYESTALGFIAGFTGNEIKRLADEKGITSDFTEIKEGMSRINVKLYSGEETEINGRGPHISGNEISKLYKKLDKLKDGDIIVISGSVPDTLSKTAYKDIMLYLGGKNIKTIVDASGELLLNTLGQRPFLIKPNSHELGEIFGLNIETKEEVCRYALKLREEGARSVLVSMAGNGAVLADENDKIFTAQVPKGKVINSVGSGDCAVAGFIAGYTESGSFEKALKTAAAAGSASAFLPGFASRDEVLKLMNCIKTERITNGFQ